MLVNTLLMVVLWPAFGQQEDRIDPTANVDAEAWQQRVRAMLQNGVTNETIRLRAATTLSPTDLKRVHEDSIKTLKASESKLIEHLKERQTTPYSGYLRGDRFSVAIDGAVLKAVYGLSEKAGDAYALDITQRRSFHRKSLAAELVVALDDRVCLTTTQAAKIEQRLSQDPKMDSVAAVVCIHHWKRPIDCLDRLRFPELSEEQAQALKDRAKVVSPRFAQLDFATFRERMRRISASRVRLLRSEMKLSDAQFRRLELSSKRHIDELVEVWKTAWATVQNDRDAVQSVAGIVNAPDLFTLFLHEGKWSTYVSQVLNEEQRAKFAARQLDRAKRAHRAMWCCMTCHYFQGWTLTAEQFESIAKVFQTLPIDEVPHRFSQKTYLALPQIGNEEFIKAIGKDHFERWERQVLGRIRPATGPPKK